MPHQGLGTGKASAGGRGNQGVEAEQKLKALKPTKGTAKDEDDVNFHGERADDFISTGRTHSRKV